MVPGGRSRCEQDNIMLVAMLEYIRRLSAPGHGSRVLGLTFWLLHPTAPAG